MAEAGNRERTAREAFLHHYRQDREAGRTPPLAEYLRRFPDDQELIAREYLALRTETIGESTVSMIERAGAPGKAPESIGPYRVIEEIDRGGQGIVYRAEDTRLHRIVAVKVLGGSGGRSEEMLGRFRREAAVASRLDHPGICPVYDAGVSQGIAFIAMKLIEGVTLARKISEARDVRPERRLAQIRLVPLPDEGESGPAGSPGTAGSARTEDRTMVARIAALFEQAGRAVHAAHEAGVIHRDLKPGNIMVTPQGQAVVMDFGLARDEEPGHESLTRTSDFFGTPAYMSPEQLDPGSQVRPDRRTDVWSLGVSLYECLTLEHPFAAASREGMFQAITVREPPDPRRANRAIPADLRVVVETALEKDPDRRYRTALAFAEDLRRVRCREPIVARPAGRWLRLLRWTQRNPSLAAALGGVFLLLTAGLTASLVFIGKLTQADERLQARGKELEKRTAELEDTTTTYESNLKHSQHRSRMLETELDANRQESERQAAGFQTDRASWQERMQSSETEVAGLRRELRHATEEGAGQADALRLGVEERNRLKTEIKELQARAASGEPALAEADRRNTELRAQIDDLTAQLAQAQARVRDLASAEAKLGEREKELETVRTGRDRLREELDLRMAENRALTLEVERLKRALAGQQPSGAPAAVTLKNAAVETVRIREIGFVPAGGGGSPRILSAQEDLLTSGAGTRLPLDTPGTLSLRFQRLNNRGTDIGSKTLVVEITDLAQTVELR